MSEQLHTAAADAQVSLRAEPEGRTLDIRLLRWGEVARTEDGPEVFTRGAFTEVDPERVVIESARHGGELVGRGLELTEDDEAPVLAARVSQTRAGDELLTLVRDGVLRSASIVFAAVQGGHRVRPDGVTERRRVDLRRVAILERGAHPGAAVLAVRRAADMEPGQIEAAEAPPAPPVVDLGPLSDRLERIESRMGALAALGAPGGPVEYRADTLGQLFLRASEEPEFRGVLAEALHERVDQLSSENPGLVRPGVLDRAVLIINRGRPAIDAQGTGPLPPDGMSVQWPVLTTPLSGLITKQTAEKTAVASGKVSFGSASGNIGTFAGWSDVSYQTIKRSKPAYLEQYSRVMLAAWAHYTDQQFTVDVLAAGTGTVVLTPAMTAAQIVGALVDASLKVATATGQPATAVVVAADLFAAIAKAYAPTSVNPTSQGGTAQASTLEVNVSGLRITLDPFLVAGTGWISNSLAAEWLEDGPFTIEVDDAEKIGRNVAYWSLGVSAVYVPAGVVKVVAAE